MDRNTLLAFVLSMGVFSLYLMWQANQPRPVAPDAGIDATQQRIDAISPDADDAPRQFGREAAGVVERAVPATPAAPAAPVDAQAPTVAPWEGVFGGDLFEARLTNRGGALTGWTLRKYSGERVADSPPEPIELVNPGESHVIALRTPFSELGFGDLSDRFYRVESESDSHVVFVLEVGGVEIRKTYDFDLDGYTFSLAIEVRNGSDRIVAPAFEIDTPTTVVAGIDYNEQSLIALHGEEVEREPIASVGNPGFFSRIFGGGDEKEAPWSGVVWAGNDYKYFASLLLPEQSEDTVAAFEPLEVGKSAAVAIRFRPVDLAPGSAAAQRLTGFFGPKDPALLESLGNQLDRSVDLGYSWVEPLTRFFQWVLIKCYAYIPNYGWSIILITILVRLCTLPILNRQMRSMEKMRALQPQLKELQAKYADDRQKQSEATMALYRETGVNPLGGCLPMLLQFPVFIGLFYALRSSFALRHAPFVGWITDLSSPEVLFVIPGLDFPFRLLPVIMGGSMFLQQKLTPTTVDPSQQMMMTVMMPIMMTVLFYQFPSGLVLYWMVSNFLGIAHQLVVGRQMKSQQQQ